MSSRLADKLTLISGAAGGIGAAVATRFVAEGATVGLIDRPGAQLDALARTLGSAAISLPTDVADEQSVVGTMATWAARFGRVDAALLFAGVQLHGEDSVAHETSLDVWQRTMTVNATGAFLCVKHVLPLMIEAGGGSLVICGSPTALTMTGAGYTAYSASKAAAMTLARTVAADYAQYGIRANCLVPGTIATPLIASLLADEGRSAELIAGIPIGRLGTPADLAGISVYLASDESAFATGATFVVDGGLTAR